MKRIIIILFCVFIEGCAVSSLDRPDSYYSSTAQSTNSILGESALGENDKRINDLLFYKTRLPEKNRLAILKLNGDDGYRYYSDEFTLLNESLISKFIDKLRLSDRLYDASFLPAMLVPKDPGVPVLREAAARFQADLLLAYRSLCNSYQKYRLVSADETRAYCSVEAILLDVRSGIIVKSVVSTQKFNASTGKKDNNFSETIKKAELEAIASALGEVALEINRYLQNVEVIGDAVGQVKISK